MTKKELEDKLELIKLERDELDILLAHSKANNHEMHHCILRVQQLLINCQGMSINDIRMIQLSKEEIKSALNFIRTTQPQAMKPQDKCQPPIQQKKIPKRKSGKKDTKQE